MTQDNEEFDEIELQALLNRAQSLPREIPPASETWGNIRDRIESTRVRTLVTHEPPSIDLPSQLHAASANISSRTLRSSRTRQTRAALAVAARLHGVVYHRRARVQDRVSAALLPHGGSEPEHRPEPDQPGARLHVPERRPDERPHLGRAVRLGRGRP